MNEQPLICKEISFQIIRTNTKSTSVYLFGHIKPISVKFNTFQKIGANTKKRLETIGAKKHFFFLTRSASLML